MLRVRWSVYAFVLLMGVVSARSAHAQWHFTRYTISVNNVIADSAGTPVIAWNFDQEGNPQGGTDSWTSADPETHHIATALYDVTFTAVYDYTGAAPASNLSVTNRLAVGARVDSLNSGTAVAKISRGASDLVTITAPLGQMNSRSASFTDSVTIMMPNVHATIDYIFYTFAYNGYNKASADIGTTVN